MHSYLDPATGRHARKRSASPLTIAALAVFAVAALSGCGPKEEPESSTTVAPAATTAAAAAPGQSPSGSVPAPDQGKVSTGADPQKAPPYPGMYGKPAGSR
jgi:hypothetical protein